MAARVRFDLTEHEGAERQLVPVVDGVPLAERAAAYERERGFDVAGGYAGLVLERVGNRDLRRFLLGEHRPWPGRRLPLLGCDCGEWGCWPLLATVQVGRGHVRWSGFEQPYRPGRDCSGLGPYEFRELQYREAVDVVAETTVRLWRPTGPEELALVAASGWRAWPPRLPDQPISYPVLDRAYPRRIAEEWNVPRGGTGYVTRFAVREEFLHASAVQQVGGRALREYWIPAEDLDALNAATVGRIELVDEFPVNG